MRYCCDEKCLQGRDCPARHKAAGDWVDGFALGFFLSSLVFLIIFILVRW